MEPVALERGRELCRERAWHGAYEALAEADRGTPLAGADLELLATAAYMVGREDHYLDGLERAHQAYADAGECLRAARCAFWLAAMFARSGEVARAGGWLARAERLVEREGRECVEQGYLLLPVAFQLEASGDLEEAIAILARAEAIAERFADRELFVLAAHEEGEVRIERGEIAAGLRLLDEAMLEVAAGELSPIVTGIVYCGVIHGCRRAYELRRAREWTAALTRWCEEQPEMVSFTGRCLIHRSEIMQVHGEWAQALQETQLAARRFAEQRDEAAAAEALYQEGEVQRLRGELEAAETAYREAAARGIEPQPGLALLRLAQGDRRRATAGIRRALEAAGSPVERIRLLPACVEIMLGAGAGAGAGAVAEARAASEELQTAAAGHDSEMLRALASHAGAAVALAEGDPASALRAARQAARQWQQAGAPYDAARARVLVGLACRALGDEDAAELELGAARTAFTVLEATMDLAALDALGADAARTQEDGLTPRERQVLRLLATGMTNRAIAEELVVSERTVERHVSNIFAKAGVASRAAATAYAYERGLV